MKRLLALFALLPALLHAQNTQVLADNTTGLLFRPTLFLTNATNVGQIATSLRLSIASAKTFTVSNTLTLAGVDGSTLNVSTGGTLGSAAFTASSAYEVPLTFTGGLTRSTNSVSITNTAVTPGSYTNANLTVGADGRLTAASNGSGGSAGTVTSVSVTTANGVSAIVTNPTTTPALAFTLGAITPTTVNGVTHSGSGSLANSGTTSLTGFTGSGTSSGTNTGDQTTISGNAATATALQTARAINGVNFDGTAPITVTAAGSTLSDTVTIAKGGTGQITANAAFNALAPSQTSMSGNYLTTNGTNTSWAALPAVVSGANPTALVGVTAVNGSASTFLRSDGAPALDQGIAPTWTHFHTWNGGTGSALTLSETGIVSTGGSYLWKVTSPNEWSLRANSGPSGTKNFGVTFNDTALSSATEVYGTLKIDSTISAGSGPTTLTDSAGKVLSAALNTVAVGQGGTGQITANAAFNALAPSQTSMSGNYLTTNGTDTSWAAVPATVSGANPTASVGLTAVNGSAGTFLRSDGAPALDATISPTWTGNHTFSKANIATTATTATLLTNPTAATISTQVQISPSLELVGSAWKSTATAASQTNGFRIYVLPTAGTTSTSGFLNFDSAPAGGGYSNIGNLDTAGNWSFSGNLTVPGIAERFSGLVIDTGNQRLNSSSVTTLDWTNRSLTGGAWSSSGNLTVSGLLKAGSGPTTLTDSAGKILSAALNTVAVGQGGTGATTFTANNILTGNTTSAVQASGATITGLGNVITTAGGATWTDDGTGALTIAAATGNKSITLAPSGTGFVAITPGTLRVGLNPSTGDAVGLPNNSPVAWRNAANSGRGGYIYVDNNNSLILAAGNTQGLFLMSSKNLLLGGLTTDGTGVLQLPAATTSAGGITMGTDVNFFRTGTAAFSLVGASTLTSLAGTGSRAVVADANGLLSAPVSDETWKENIRALPEKMGLNTVLALRPIVFNYRNKSRFGSQDYIGFGARATSTILPEVTGRDRDGVYYLTDEKITAPLVLAVQQQQRQIAALESSPISIVSSADWWARGLAILALLLSIRANLKKSQ